ASVSYKPSSGGTATTLANNVTYEPFGPVGGFSYGNGLAHALTYDKDYRLSGITTGGSVQSFTLGYDAASDVTSIKDNLDATRTQAFTYDKDYRLLTASGKYGADSYSYDADGNRKTATEAGIAGTYSYPTTSNRLASIVSGAVTEGMVYTANGDTASDGTQVFTYGNRNRMEQAVTGGATAVYKYNAMGQRMLKTAGTNVTSYQYDLKGHLIAESNGTTGALTREYVYLGDMPLAQIESAGAIYYVHPDHLGTPQRMTGSTGAIVFDRVQHPFGVQYSLTGAATNNLRFPGQYFDAETGLSQNWMRSYSSRQGIYKQGDPIGLRGGVNLFGYVGGNPVNAVDPTGKNPLLLVGILAEFFADEAGTSLLLDSIFGNEIAAGAGTGVGVGAALKPTQSGTGGQCYVSRYAGQAEAKAAQESGFIPNTTIDNNPKTVFVTPDEPVLSAEEAENNYQIGAQNPTGASPTPTHIITGDPTGIDFNYGGNVLGGNGTELTTKQAIPV
ncbi:MAG TPA: RHS repeat-associated core domain-containing protein, partial [Candidatus Saccharimonadales bacterium]|nr:RHS repeat-associated core domain-containing protein [Candidatus Saccharimonadales bacterium]